LSEENPNLASAVNDRARKIRRPVGNQVIVPLKFAKDGSVSTSRNRIFKRLSLTDLRFLKVWRESGWDIEKAVKDCQIPPEKSAKLIQKLACFREEDARVRALCEIPTPDWIAAKHVENLYAGGSLADSEHKSLAELAKIEGAYKQQSALTQVNVFNLPAMTPEVENELKQLARRALDTEAA